YRIHKSILSVLQISIYARLNKRPLSREHLVCPPFGCYQFYSFLAKFINNGVDSIVEIELVLVSVAYLFILAGENFDEREPAVAYHFAKLRLRFKNFVDMVERQIAA